MALEPECSQPISLTAANGAFSPFHLASLEVRKGSIAPFGTPSSNDAICAFETFKRRPESAFSGHFGSRLMGALESRDQAEGNFKARHAIAFRETTYLVGARVLSTAL
jgi:hypothetical protein